MLALEQLGGCMTVSAIDEIVGTIVTENEVFWLTELRDASDGSDPRLTQRARVAQGVRGQVALDAGRTNGVR